jgi:hypothetical protein
MKRVPCSEKARQEIRTLLGQGIAQGDPKSELMQIAMRLICRHRWYKSAKHQANMSPQRSIG